MQPNGVSIPLAGRVTFWLFVPATVALYLWLLVAPSIYGTGGWGGLGVLFFLGPSTVLFLGLVLGLVLASPARPRGFTALQAVTAWTMWVAVFLAGVFFADGGDGPSGPSVFTHFVGQDPNLVQLGENLMSVFAGLMFLSAVALLVELVATAVLQRRRAITGFRQTS